jgi:uncharacterized glyoxalase superfamily protein PhnB
MVQSIPDGFHTLTPHLVVRRAAKAIEFYKKAFGAEEIMRAPAPGGQTIMHAEIRIGDSIVMLTDEWPDAGCVGPQSLKGTPITLHLYVQDADAAWKRAVGAGATVKMPLENQFWGDRYGLLEDPFGHAWSISQHIADYTPEQIARGAEKAFAQHASGGQEPAKDAGKPPKGRRK